MPRYLHLLHATCTVNIKYYQDFMKVLLIYTTEYSGGIKMHVFVKHYAPCGNKIRIYFRHKGHSQGHMLLILLSFERALLVEYLCQI